MGAISTERVVGHETDSTTLEDLDFEFVEACEIPARATHVGWGTPACKGDQAEWIGWRPNCCPASPNFMLLCSACKRKYQDWIAKAGFIVCGDCGTETGGFLAYTPLKG